MKEQIENFLQAWENGTKNIDELKSIYCTITEKELKDCPSCQTKALTEIRKYYHLNFELKQDDIKGRKYILKPGKHQLAPGEKAIHTNENTTDAQLKWYLEQYPHIKTNLI